MKKTLMAFTLNLAVLTCLIAQATPVATVKLGSRTDIITRDDFNSRLQVFELQAGRKMTVDEQKQLLQAYISEVLFYQAALEAGQKASEAEMIAALKQQVPGAANLTVAQFKEIYEQETGVPWNKAKGQLEKSFLAQKFLREKAQPMVDKIKDPTEDELRDFYDKNKSQMISPDMALVKHIFLTTEGKKESDVLSEMNRIWREINSKKITFDEAVNRYTQDEASKTKGGILGGNYLTYNNPQAEKVLGASFIKTAMNMKEAEISKPIKSSSGYHIIIVERKLPAKILDYEGVLPVDGKTSVKESLRQQIRMIQEQSAARQALEITSADLQKKASIQILDKTLQ